MCKKSTAKNQALFEGIRSIWRNKEWQKNAFRHFDFSAIFFKNDFRHSVF
jgi:hypothetical protein